MATPFSNTAYLTYNGIEVGSNTVTGQILDVLNVTKTATPQAYQPGGSITYTVSIVNTSTAPYTDLTLTDNLGAYAYGTGTLYPLNYEAGTILYYVNGALQSTLTPTDTEPLTVTGINVPAGGNAMLVYRATVNQYAPPNLGSTVNNTATVYQSTTAIASDSETITAQAAPSLSLSKAVSPVSVAENGQITYTITIVNNGNTATSSADDLVITDTFNPVISITSVTYNGQPLTLGTGYTYNTTNGAFATVDGAISVDAATASQDTAGNWNITPGTGTLVITGTV